MGLQEQVKELRKKEVEKATEAGAGEARKQIKSDLVGDKYSSLLMEAQRVARDIGQRGPICIDDVTIHMSTTLMRDVLPSKQGTKEQRWKGKVFNKSEWQMVGYTKAKLKTSNSRMVALWALKTWLQSNTMNGKRSTASAFVVSQIWHDFKQVNSATIDFKQCMWYIGEKMLSSDIKQSIEDGKGTLYGIPVTIVPNAVGATLKG